MDKVTKISGAAILVDFLKSAGVDTIFCITGAGNLAIVDAIESSKSFKVVYSHHEQAAVMEAQGYSRLSGKVGVALVTTGGGTSNTVTGILSAHLDSIPILVVSGNESSFHCQNQNTLRAYGVQGFDSVAVMKPITKFSSRITTAGEIASFLQQGLHEALSGRKGPVLIDFPMDLQRTITNYEKQSPTIIDGELDKKFSEFEIISRLSSDICKSNRPILYIGNGCRDSKTLAKLHEFIEKTQIPFALSWSALDLLGEFPHLNIGRIGIYGDRSANILLQRSDLVLALGTRLAIPQIGYNKSDFGRLAKKWVVDIDETECGKFNEVGWEVINGGVREILSTLLDQEVFLDDSSLQDWKTQILKINTELPRAKQCGPREYQKEGFEHSNSVIEFLNESADPEAIYVTDVGAGLLSGHYSLEPKVGQRVFTSQGLGEMGFGLPGAIGAYFADPSKQIICLNTDGAIMFNLQELQVVTEHRIPLKLFVFNNSGYSMIKISQDNLFGSRHSGSTTESGISFPNFRKVAELFNFTHLEVDSIVKQEAKVKELLKSQSAVLFEIKMSPNQRYLPRLATTKLHDGTLVSPPLEDLDPLIPIEKLEEYLGYKPHRESFRAREIEYNPDEN
jgi:acetolactate synthase-1/2/3 large subunit